MISRAGVFVVVEAIRTRAGEALVNERIPKGNCCACPSDDVRPYVKCGNCERCDATFNRKMDELSSDAERAEYEAECYRRGLRLNPQEIRKFKTKSAFDEVLAEVKKRK